MLLSIINQMIPSNAIGWIGTIISTIAVITFIVSSGFDNKNLILKIQCVGHVLLGISEFLSKSFSSIVQEIISITRNVFVYFGKNTKIVNYVLISAGIIFGTYCCILGQNWYKPWNGIDFAWYNILPIFANAEYSIIVMKEGLDVKWIKLSFAVSSYLWALCFMLTGPGLFFSGFLNAINGTVALVAFIKIQFFTKETTDLISTNEDKSDEDLIEDELISE